MAARRRPYDVVKRGLDVLGAAVGLIVTSPVQAVVAILVLRSLGRPIFFVQERPGRDGRIFRLVKFRTMRLADPGEDAVSDHDRMTAFGFLLRSWSLDELPTLVNVLLGHMSIVGPRPLHVRYLERYSAHQARRHEVRPGVTGLAQVSGRNLVEWGPRLNLDVEYVDRRSFLLDAAILFKTARVVVSRDGIAEDGHVTMTEFRGDDGDRTTADG